MKCTKIKLVYSLNDILNGDRPANEEVQLNVSDDDLKIIKSMLENNSLYQLTSGISEELYYNKFNQSEWVYLDENDDEEDFDTSEFIETLERNLSYNPSINIGTEVYEVYTNSQYPNFLVIEGDYGKCLLYISCNPCNELEKYQVIFACPTSNSVWDNYFIPYKVIMK